MLHAEAAISAATPTAVASENRIIFLIIKANS